MYKIYFMEVIDDEQEVGTLLGTICSDDIYDAYIFIADYMHNSGSINCFMVPNEDDEDPNIIYVDILTVSHYFMIVRLLN